MFRLSQHRLLRVSDNYGCQFHHHPLHHHNHHHHHHHHYPHYPNLVTQNILVSFYVHRLVGKMQIVLLLLIIVMVVGLVLINEYTPTSLENTTPKTSNSNRHQSVRLSSVLIIYFRLTGRCLMESRLEIIF